MNINASDTRATSPSRRMASDLPPPPLEPYSQNGAGRYYAQALTPRIRVGPGSDLGRILLTTDIPGTWRLKRLTVNNECTHTFRASSGARPQGQPPA